MTLLGPRMLNEIEVRTQKRAPLPYAAPAHTAAARHSDPVSGTAAGPVAVVDIFLAPPTIFATSPCRAA